MTLVGWWKLDGAVPTRFTGTTGIALRATLPDATRGGHPLLGVSGPIAAGGSIATAAGLAAGTAGQAVSLKNAYAAASANTLRAVRTAWTISGWIKLPAATGVSSLILGSEYDRSVVPFALVYNRDGRYPGRVAAALYNGAWREAISTTALTPGVKAYLAATFDGSALRIYVNGVLEATTSGVTPAAAPLSYARTILGGHWVPTPNTAPKSGPLTATFDDFAVFNVALNSTQINAIYADNNALWTYTTRALEHTHGLTTVTANAPLLRTTNPSTLVWSVASPPRITRPVVGATSSSSVTAHVPTLVRGTARSVMASTARLVAGAGTPLLVVRASKLTLTSPTPRVFMPAPYPPYPVVGIQRAGNDFYNPIVLRGSAGTVAADMANYDVQLGEPTFTLAPASTVWMQHESLRTGLIKANVVSYSGVSDTYSDTYADIYSTASVSGGAVVEAMYGREIDQLQEVPASNSITALDVVAQTRSHLRIATGAASGIATIAWTFTPTGADSINMTIFGNVIDHTPANLVFSALTLPNEAVRISIPRAGFYRDYVTDGSGVIARAKLLLPQLGAGSYTLRATNSRGAYDEENFTVLNDAVVRPTAPVADAAPVLITQTGSVRRWVLQDLTPGGLGSYVVPINPATQTTPIAPSAITSDPTVAPDGQWHLWEGATRATPWRFSGRLLTQAHLEHLDAYALLRQRIYIIDHRNRAWKCVIDKFSATPIAGGSNPWVHDYEISAQVFGMVQL
jgi:Concanavalin A-like lectin/glucanases superfamily